MFSTWDVEHPLIRLDVEWDVAMLIAESIILRWLSCVIPLWWAT